MFELFMFKNLEIYEQKYSCSKNVSQPHFTFSAGIQPRLKKIDKNIFNEVKNLKKITNIIQCLKYVNPNF